MADPSPDFVVHAVQRGAAVGVVVGRYCRHAVQVPAHWSRLPCREALIVVAVPVTRQPLKAVVVVLHSQEVSSVAPFVIVGTQVTAVLVAVVAVHDGRVVVV